MGRPAERKSAGAKAREWRRLGGKPAEKGPRAMGGDRPRGQTDCRWKKSHEAVARVQARGREDSHRPRNGRSGEKGSEIRQTWKAKPVGVAGSQVWSVGAGEKTGGSKDSGLNHWKDGDARTGVGGV